MNLNDLNPNDIIEYALPTRLPNGKIDPGPQSGRFGVGRLIKIENNHKKRRKDIFLKNNLNEKTIIEESNIRWDRTQYHKEK